METDEAEITVVVHFQRVRAGVSRIERRVSNGPLRVRRKEGNRQVFRNVWHTLVAGDMSVSCKVHGASMKQGGTAG